MCIKDVIKFQSWQSKFNNKKYWSSCQ